jgi:hypothetical protein
MSDFFREVDEELRREKMQDTWDRYGLWFIIVAVAIVAGTAGFRGLSWYQDRQAKQAGQQFYDAVLEARESPAEAMNALANLAQGGTGYAALAQLRLAGAQAEAGDIEAAIASFDALAADRGADDLLRDVARVRAGYLMIDRADLAAMQARLDGMAAEGQAFRHSAREVLGLTAYRNGDYSAAQEYFDALLADPGVPGEMRQRGQTMQALLVGRAPIDAASAAADGEATQ